MTEGMKRVGLAVGGFVALLVVSCTGKSSSGESQVGGDDTTTLGRLERQLEAFPMDSVNYALGYVQGKQLKRFELKIDEKFLLNGLRDGLSGKEGMADEQAGSLLRRYVQLQSQVSSERNARRSTMWLDSVAAIEGVTRAESGLVYRVVKSGEGASATDSSYVQVHIVVRDMAGKELENTHSGEPVTFRLDQGLRCWVEGLKYIREGGSIELYSPASLAYGTYAANGIAPNSAMHFDVDLLKILTKAEYEATTRQR